MSYNSGGGAGMHKRPYDNAQYQSGGEFPGVVVDIKRSRSDQIGGGGGGGGAGIYGVSGGGQSGAFPRQPGKETCINFRRTGACKFGASCNYDHPPEAHPCNLGTGGFPAGTTAPPGPSTNGPSQPVQHGLGPRQASQQLQHQQQQPHNQQQQRQQHPYAQKPQSLQQTPASQQQPTYSTQPQLQQPPYGQQPHPVTRASPGQHRSPLPLTPGSPAPAGVSSAGGGFSANSYGNKYGGGANSSSSTTPSAPALAQPPGTQLGSRPPLPTPFSSAESTAPAAATRTPDGFEAPSPSIAPIAHGAVGFTPETPTSERLQQGSAVTHTSTTQGAVDPSDSLPAAASTATGAGSWVYDHTTGGYKISPPPLAPLSSAEPARGATIPGTSGTPAPSSQQLQQPGNVHGTSSAPLPTVTFPGGQAFPSVGDGYNGATARHNQGSATTGLATVTGAPVISPGCATTYNGQQQQQQQPQPSISSTLLAGAPAGSTYNSTRGQYSVYPGATTNAPGESAAVASCGGLAAPVSIGYGVASPSLAATSEHALQGMPSVYGVLPTASPQQAHGVSNQTPSVQFGDASSAKGTGATASAAPAFGDTVTQRGSSSYRGVPSTGALQQGCGAAPVTTPTPTAEDYATPGSTGSAVLSQYGAYGALPSYGGQASAGSASGTQVATAMSDSIPVSLRSHQAGASLSPPTTNGNRSAASATTGSLALVNKSPSVTKARATTAASRGGRSSADAETSFSSTPPITAPATSASKIDPMASAAAAYAAQQATAGAATITSCPPGTLSSAGSTYIATGHTAGYMPPSAETQKRVAVATVSSAGQFVQPPGPDAAQSSATGSCHGADHQLRPPTTGQNAVAQQPQMAQSVSASSPHAMATPQQRTPQQTTSPHGFPQHLWQQQQPPQQPLQQQQQLPQNALGGPGIFAQPAQGGYSGYGHPLHVVTPQHQQQQQQSPHGFSPAVPSYGPPPGAQTAAGPVGPSGPGGPSRGFNVAGPGGYPNNRTGPSSVGGPPLQNMLPGIMATPVMMGAPGMIGAPPPQNLPPGLIGPGGSSGPPGGRQDGPVGLPGGRHGVPGGLGGPLGQATVQYSVERPTPNMPQRSNMPDCHSFVKSGSCRFALACKYHHPYNRVGMPVEFDDSQGVVGAQDRAPCDVYLNTGLCTFGDKCRFRHISRGQLTMESAQGISHPDPNQLPKRAGHPPCGFYARTGKCAFGMKCKFDHPTHRNPPPGVYSATIVSTSGSVSSPSTQMTNGRQGATTVRPPVPLPQAKPQLKGPSEVTARHILVKHKGSRRPASWQDPTGVAIKQRTQAQATTTLQALRRGIKTQDDFSKVAMSKSDCSSAKRGGDLGSFSRGKMQRAFEDAAFGLQIGGLSGVVSTDSGVHVIMRTA